MFQQHKGEKMNFICLLICSFLFSSCINTRIYIMEKGKSDYVTDDDFPNGYGHFHFGPSPGDVKIYPEDL